MRTDAPDHDPELDRARSIAALIARVAGAAGVHMYEMEWTSETDYRCLVWVGRALESLLGGVPAGMDAEAAWEHCIHPDDRAAYEAMFPVLQQGVAAEIEYRLVGFDGVTRWVWERCMPYAGPDGRRRVDGIVTDITERHTAQEQLAAARDRLEHIAYHDPLTGLPNRRLFHEHLELAVERCGRTRSTVAVLFIDLDDFKQVNDRYGHAFGDSLLRAVAERLTRVLRAGDVTARLGGDEFLMLVSLDDPRSGPAAARSVAARVRRALEEPVTPEGGGADLSIAVSVGVALYPHDADDPEALVRAADAAMYLDKAGRRRRAA